MRWLLLTFICFLFFVVSADEEDEMEFQTNSAAMLNIFEDEMGMLDEVRARFKRGKYREGIELLQVVMEKAFKGEKAVGRLYHRSENVYIPVEEYCFQLLRELPFEGFDLYLTLYSATAENMLKRALAEGDIKGVELVSRLYPLTDSALKALLLLADCSLEAGDGAKTLQYLRRAEHLMRRKTPSMALKTAAAMLLQDMEKSAAELLKSLNDNEISEKERRIKKNLLSQIKTTSKHETRSDIFNSFYESISSFKVPNDIASISKPETFDWEFELARKEQRRRDMVIPNLFPLVINDVVYAVNSRKVCALRVNGGKLLWRYPRGTSPPVNEFGPYAMETDGRLLFTVLGSTKPFKLASEQPRRPGVIVIRRGRRGWNLSNNDLYAFDITDKNRLLWEAKEMNPGIDSLVFVTPPRLAGEHIVIGGIDMSRNDSVYFLCCFSKEGELLWKTRILSITQQEFIPPASVEYMDGEVFFLTNKGVLASVNVYTGDLLWAALYPITRMTDQPGRRTSPLYTLNVTPPLLWKGVRKGRLRRAVIIAPSDSDFIMAYDIDARRLLWLEEKEGHSFFFRIYDDLVLATGGRSKVDTSKKAVCAYHMFTGKIELHFETEESVVAKGLISGDTLLLPCSQGLLQLALSPSESKRYLVGKRLGFYKWFSPSAPPAPPAEEQRRQTILKGCGNIILLKNRLITGFDRWLHSYEFGH